MISTEEPASPPAAVAPGPTEVAPRPVVAPIVPNKAPGRDLFVFLLLLFVIDLSSVIHIYGLQQIYGEPLFAGFGVILLLLAVLLLILPRNTRPDWLRLPFTSPLQVAALYLVVGLAAAALAQLLLSLFNGPEWYPLDPAPEPYGPIRGLLFLLASFVAVPLFGLLVAYHPNERLRRALLALLLCAFGLLQFVNVQLILGVGANWAPDTWRVLLGSGWPVLAVGAGLLLLAGLLTFAGPRLIMFAAVAAGLVMRLVVMEAVPISLGLGDMLPLVQQATTRLINGQNPYIIYQFPWEVPLTYWPLTILTYAPFTALQLDLRYANLLFGPLLVALLWRRADKTPLACYAFALLYLTPAMLQWDITTAAPAFWIWLCVLLVLVASRSRWAGVATGLAFAAAPLALPFAPFVAARWLLSGWRQLFTNIVLAALAGLVLVGPFLLWDFAGFWNGAVAWFNDINNLPRFKWEIDQSWELQAGLAGQFWRNRLEDLLKPLQIILISGLAALALVRRLSPAETLRWGTAAYILFMIFNPVIWPYLYVPVLLGLIFTLRAEDQESYFIPNPSPVDQPPTGTPAQYS